MPETNPILQSLYARKSVRAYRLSMLGIVSGMVSTS